MHHELDPIEAHFESDSIIFGPWTVKKDDENKDIKPDGLRWYLYPSKYDNDPEDAVLSHDDAGVEVEKTNPTEGEWQVMVSQEATDSLGGATYWQRPVVDPSGDSKLTWRGEVKILL